MFFLPHTSALNFKNPEVQSKVWDILNCLIEQRHSSLTEFPQCSDKAIVFQYKVKAFLKLWLHTPYAPNVKVAHELAMERKIHGNIVGLIMKVKDKNITLYF